MTDIVFWFEVPKPFRPPPSCCPPSGDIGFRSSNKTWPEEPLAARRRLTTSDHVESIATRPASDGDPHEYFSPYDRPHEAYLTFMNVLDDLRARAARALAELTPPPTQAPAPQPRTTKSTRRNRR